MKPAVILLAAGSGSRIQSITKDKVLLKINGLPVFSYSYRTFLHAGMFSTFVIVYRDSVQQASLGALLALTPSTEVLWVKGGAERQDSVRNALQALPSNCSHVFIHDVARPLVTPELILQIMEQLKKTSAVIASHRVVDTIKKVAPTSLPNQYFLQDMQRSTLWAMETPQAFELSLIRKAYEKIHAEKTPITDDAAAVSLLGEPVTLVENLNPNPKLTTPHDIDYMLTLLKKAPFCDI